MPPKGAGKGSQAKPKPDDRFSTLLKQPRFKTKTANTGKASIQDDERFKDVFEDDDFSVKKIDNFQRVQKKNTKEALSTLYTTNDTKKSASKRKLPPQATKQQDSDDDDDDDDNDDEKEETMGDSDQELEEDSTDIGTTDDDLDDHDDLDEDDEEIIPDGFTLGSLPGSYAPIIDNPTQRLALYNMEWDQLRAVDILAIFRSLCPLGGKIARVSVYPSEKGKIMLDRERRGDFTLWTDPKMDELAKQIREEKLKRKQSKQNKNSNKKNKKQKQEIDHQDDDELSDSDEYLSDTEIDKLLFGNDEEDKKIIEANRVRLKEYELAKLGYYYAILDCDSVDTAVKLYQEADGLEYESSGNVFDLRFVPDEHVFDEKTLRDRATIVPPGHRPPVYQTNCLNSTRLECTWERDDPKRSRFLQQDYTKNDYRVDDLTAFLANESDEEGFATDVPISETDDETESNTEDDDDDDDEDDGSDNEYVGSGITEKAPKVRSDTLGRDRIVTTKVVDGKKKNVLMLKRRARNEFADILAEIKSDSKEIKNKQDKKDILKKANKDLNSDGDDDDDDKVVGTDDDDNDNEKDDFGSSDSDDAPKVPIKKAKKPLIVLQSTVATPKEYVAPSKKHTTQHTKESIKSLNLPKFRAQRLNQWQETVEKAEQTKEKGKQVLSKVSSLSSQGNDAFNIDKNAALAKKKETLNQKQQKLASIKGSIYDDDVVDDDDFFKHSEEYFPEAEFGAVSFTKGGKNSMGDNNNDDDGDDSDVADARVKAKLQASKKRKAPAQSLDNDSDSDQDEGYNLQELVKKNTIKQVAIQNKKKSAKEQENDLINQALGMDTYTTTQNTALSTKDLKQAAYLVNKQAVNKDKNKKLKVNLNELTAKDNTDVSLTTGGPVDVGFKVDVHDTRFAGVFDDADFGIDTTSALFQNTEGTSDILAEAQRRRTEKQTKQVEATKKRKAGAPTTTAPSTGTGKKTMAKHNDGVSDELAQLISKTKNVASTKSSSKRKL